MSNCPHCFGVVTDDDTIQERDGVIWHARCKDQHDTNRRKLYAPNTATECPPGLLGLRPVSDPPPICYHLTETCFKLEIPVEALANLTPDAHTRMLAMLNDWITRHKPPTVNDADRDQARREIDALLAKQEKQP